MAETRRYELTITFERIYYVDVPAEWDKDDVETAAYESLHNVPAPDPNRHYRQIWVNTMEDIGERPGPCRGREGARR